MDPMGTKGLTRPLEKNRHRPVIHGVIRYWIGKCSILICNHCENLSFFVIFLKFRILGGKALGLGFCKPKAKMSLFAERDIPTGDNKYVAGMCEIGNGDEKVFVIHHSNNACMAQFHSVQLKNIRRPDRGRNDELVTDQKFAFVFYTSIIICGRSIALKVNNH